MVAVELYVDDGMGAVLDDDSSGSETLPSMDRVSCLLLFTFAAGLWKEVLCVAEAFGGYR